MTLPIIFIAIMGSVNFALHRAMLESDNPLVQEALAPMLRTFGQYATYGLEFILLVAALMLGIYYPILALFLYGAYTLLDLLAYAFLIHGQ